MMEKTRKENRELKKKKIPLLHVRGNALFLTHVKHARTTWERFKGLLGVSSAQHDYALVFHLEKKGRMRASIHMLFMRMPIDVLFLDENKKIVDKVENLQPWTVNYTPKKTAKYVVELPAHTLRGLRANKAGLKVEWN